MEQQSSFTTTEAKRFGGQCEVILSMLRDRGRISNRDLASVALKYSSRITDLRNAGHNIVCVDHDKKTGLAHYELRDEIWQTPLPVVHDHQRVDLNIEVVPK
jgi:hypothetical protein